MNLGRPRMLPSSTGISTWVLQGWWWRLMVLSWEESTPLHSESRHAPCCHRCCEAQCICLLYCQCSSQLVPLLHKSRSIMGLDSQSSLHETALIKYIPSLGLIWPMMTSSAIFTYLSPGINDGMMILSYMILKFQGTDVLESLAVLHAEYKWITLNSTVANFSGVQPGVVTINFFLFICLPTDHIVHIWRYSFCHYPKTEGKNLPNYPQL